MFPSSAEILPVALGCGQRNPVESVSVDDSGIELRDAEWSLANQKCSEFQSLANLGKGKALRFASVVTKVDKKAPTSHTPNALQC